MADEETGAEEAPQHDQLPSADEIIIDKPPRSRKKCRRLLLGCGIVLAVAATFAGGLVVGQQPWKSKSDDTQQQVVSGTVSGDEKQGVTDPDPNDESPGGEDVSYITTTSMISKGIAINGGDEFEKATSYQSLALEIMQKHDIITYFYYTDQKLAQRYALLCLFFRTNRVRTDVVDARYGYGTTPRWKVFDPWNFENDECSWYGIACNLKGLVVRIELPSHLLTGYIPMELKHLANGPLSVIDFSGNGGLGQGGFPQVFLEFNTLDALSLEGCNYSGDVPDAMCEKDITFFQVNCGLSCSCCEPVTCNEK